ncbi:MAG: alpha/beta fold hydrolase [Thaumarchaeota archaeon]|nr:alpha/beta fold hydrolase [Nitrososphaerota archaeon]
MSMEPKSVSKSVRKSGISTVAAVIMTAILIGSVVGGAGYVYSTQTDAIVSELKSENSKLGTQVRTSQDETAKLNSRIISIQDEGRNLKSHNDQLNSQIKIVADDNNRLKSLNDNLNSRIRASDEDSSRLRSQINDLNGRISEANEKIVALTRSAVASFEFIPQPQNIRVNISAGVKVRFLRFTTVDGVNLNGYLWEPQDRKPHVAMLIMHGTGSNYTAIGQRLSIDALASRGYAVLAINDRQWGPNRLKANFNDHPKDIAAGVSILKSLGYSNIILHGYSFGAENVAMYASVSRDTAIKGVILGGATANRPWKTKVLSEALKPGLYNRLYSAAKEFVAQGKPTAILPEKMPFVTAPTDVGAITFITAYSPESLAVTTTNIRRITVPILIIRAQDDSWVLPYEPLWIIGNATAPGSEVPNVKYIQLPSNKPPSPSGHTLVGHEQTYVNTVLAWLQEMKLG